MDQEFDELQGGPPAPHAVEDYCAIDTRPHEGHGHAHQDEEDAVHHQLGVLVAKAQAVRQFGQDLSAGMLFNTVFEFHLQHESMQP